MPGSELLHRHRAVMPSWLTLYYESPIELVSGSGCRVTDAEGRTYLDLFGGILTTMTGHSIPEVVEAIREQAGKMLHSSTLYLIRPMVELAERIAGLSGIPDAKVFFVNSGSEANETALLLASSYRRSNQVIALRNSYHGRSFATIGITGNRGWSPSSLSPFSVHYVHNGYRLRSPFGNLDDAGFIDACADDLRNVIETTTAGDVATMIAEPIQGVGGFCIPPDGFFGAMKKVLDEYEILFISDEVQTGWGRTGEHFWGYQAHGVVPDALTFAKGLGNGLAIAGLVARADLMDSLNANSLSTFGGNPLATAGALANLNYLLDQRPAGQRASSGVVPPRTAPAPRRPLRNRGRGARSGVDDRHRARGGGRHDAEPTTGHRVPRSVQGERCARRQGRPLRQLPTRRASVVDHARGSRGRRRGDRRRAHSSQR